MDEGGQESSGHCDCEREIDANVVAFVPTHFQVHLSAVLDDDDSTKRLSAPTH